MIKISERLYACSSIIREGSRLCDVGCDHGYVPVALLEAGKIKSAVACDVNNGPLNSCKRLVKEHSLDGKIKCLLSDGLEQVDENEVDDILLAGMGGELIADILSKCTWVNKKHIVMNPMTHPEILREWLYNNGFEIDTDIIVRDGKHFYSVLDASYTGVIKERTRADYFLGNIKDFSNSEYFVHLLNYLKNKQRGGEDFSDVISEIEVRL